LLLLVVAAEHNALHADRLVDAHHHGKRRVDLPELLRHAAVAGLAESAAAVLSRHVQPEEPALAELGDLVVADPALVLNSLLVVILGELARLLDQLASSSLVVLRRTRKRED